MSSMDTRTEQVLSPQGSGGGRPRRRAGDALRAQILDAIEEYWREYGRPPTIREIGSAVGVRATSHVAHHVNVLVQEGLLVRDRGSRGLRSTRPVGLPVLGTIAAGNPLDLFAPGAPELLELGELSGAMTSLPVRSLAAASDVFALRVRGTSMIEDGILDGDYVLIAPGSTVANGAIAVVL